MMHIESPRTGDPAVEQMIKAAGADVAPRITAAEITANIASEHYFTAAEGVLGMFVAGEQAAGRSGNCPTRVNELKDSLNLLTFCVLVLRNGFTVTGESACASPENFNAEIGRRIARQQAVGKIWLLMGYELKSRLAAVSAAVARSTDYQGRVRAECADLNGKIERLGQFFDTDQFRRLPAAEQERLSTQRNAMDDYAAVLRERIAAFNEGATK